MENERNSKINNDVTILVCCHKKDYFHKGAGFLPIQVGKSISNVDLGMQGDNIGDNISELNPNFCELTAHYWLWKNGPKTKYVGLNHYRRYFDFNRKSASKYIPVKNTTEKDIIENFPELPQLDAIFDDYDIILPMPNIYFSNLSINYNINHIPEDLKVIENIIHNDYPQYIESYNAIMNRSNRLSHYNMFITKWSIFEDYSKWIFDILFKAKEKIKVSDYPYQARVFGFLSERLFNVYVHQKHLNVKFVPILKVCDDKSESKWKTWLRGVKWDTIFHLMRLKI